MGRSVELVFRSELAAPPAAVWAVISTMAGVNAELRPWVRMTHPAGVDELDPGDVEPGEVVFRSWLLAFGVLPFDRHSLAFERIADGEGFDEESTSWLQRRWRHERRLAPSPGGGTIVTDRLVVVPRIGLARPLVAHVVRFLFGHRHRRLVARFDAP